MNQTVINGRLSLAWPDGFHEMDKEELKTLYLDDNPDRWGIWDRDRHIVITVFWHASNALLSAFAGADDIAKSTEKKLRKVLKNHSYRNGGFFRTSLCGQEVPGFRYAYRLGDAEQTAETIVLKEKAVCYTIYYYAREELSLASRPVFDDVLNSMRLL